MLYKKNLDIVDLQIRYIELAEFFNFACEEFDPEDPIGNVICAMHERLKEIKAEIDELKQEVPA